MFTNSFPGRPQDHFAGQLISHGNKDILFTDYNPTLKAMRKIAHGALKAYGDGLIELEQSVLEEAEALFKRFDLKNGEGFDPRNDLGKSGSFYCKKRFKDIDWQTILEINTPNFMKFSKFLNVKSLFVN